MYSVRKITTRSFHDIIAQLERAGKDLVDLAINFVSCWSDVKISLGSLQSSVSHIKLDGSSPLRQDIVLKRWEWFRDQYVQYQRRVREVPCIAFSLADTSIE